MAVGPARYRNGWPRTMQAALYHNRKRRRSRANATPLAPAIANQTMDFGALTLADAGGAIPTNTGGAITSASIDSGDASSHWQIASDGTITPTAAGDTADLNLGPYALVCTFTNAIDSDAATITITPEADTYTVSDATEYAAVLAQANAAIEGNTIKGRSGEYAWSNGDLNNKVFASLVTITSHDASNPMTFVIDNVTSELRQPINITFDSVKFLGGLTGALITSPNGMVILKGPINNFTTIRCEADGRFRDLVALYGDPFDSNWSWAGLYSKDGTTDVTGDMLIEDCDIHDLARGLTLPDCSTGSIDLIGNDFHHITVDGIRYDGPKPNGGLVAWNTFRDSLPITPPEVQVLSVDTANDRMTADSDQFGAVSGTVVINISESTTTPPGGTNFPGIGGGNDYSCTILSITSGQTELQFPVDITDAGTNVFIRTEPSHADWAQSVPQAGSTVDGVRWIGNDFFGAPDPEDQWPQSLFLEDIAGVSTDGWYDNITIAGNRIWGGAAQGIWLYNARDCLVAVNMCVGPADIGDTADLPYISLPQQFSTVGERNVVLNNIAWQTVSNWSGDVLSGNTDLLPAGYAASGKFAGTGGYDPETVEEFVTAFARQDLAGTIDYDNRTYDLPEINTVGAFSFTDLTDQVVNTVVTSAAVQITGIVDSEGSSSSFGAYVSVYDGTDDEFRITTDAAGLTVVTDWTSTPAIIENNEYLWVRQRTSASNSTETNIRVRVGSVTDTWSATTIAAGFSAVTFDGINDYADRAGQITGLANGRQFTFGIRIALGGDGTFRSLFADLNGAAFLLQIRSTNRLRVFTRDILAAVNCQYDTDAGTLFLAADGTVTILVAVDLTTNTVQVYKDDTDVATAAASTTNSDVDRVSTDWGVMAEGDGTGRTPGDVEFVWFDDSYLDISIQENRDAFAAGSIGATGDGPTGSDPLVYLTGNAAAWNAGGGLNLGTGGAFNMTGAVVDV